MTVEQLNSHYFDARKYIIDGDFDAAICEAELAVDEFWRDADPRIAAALPLLSFLQHKNQIGVDLFTTLDDLPTRFSEELLAEAKLLHEEQQNVASERMLSDVERFLRTWSGQSLQENVVLPDTMDASDEKITELRSQILQFYADGKRDLAVETSLELANEYAIRRKDRRAFGIFVQVLKKSKRPGRTSIRINGLLDFGQFMSRLGRTDDAERLLRLASGVAKKARDSEKFSHAIASLGVVLMHASKNEQAKKYLKKASQLLSPWDVESDIVNDHLEALREGRSCDCPESATRILFDVADWD